LAAAAGLLLVAVWVSLDAWLDIAHIAVTDEEASHILLVPMVAGWLFWARKDALSAVRPGTSWVGPALVAVGALVGWWGYHHQTQAAWHAGAVLLAVGAVLSVLGRGVLLAGLPAFVVLLFLVPVPGGVRQTVALPMQNVTAAVSEGFLELAGMPVARSGNVLRYNGVDVAVAEACNGMRMVFALILVAYAYAFATPLRGYVRAIILVASPVLAIVCNIIRLVPTVYVYGHFSKGFAGTFHDLSGWAMLAVAFFALMGIVSLLQWAQVPVMRRKARPAARPRETYGTPSASPA
jgi:exosortase